MSDPHANRTTTEWEGRALAFREEIESGEWPAVLLDLVTEAVEGLDTEEGYEALRRLSATAARMANTAQFLYFSLPDQRKE